MFTTDSMLIINTMTKWIFKWEKNNYIKSDGNIVKNLELVKLLRKQSQLRPIEFKHVHAHTNDNTWESFYNNKADKYAKLASRS